MLHGPGPDENDRRRRLARSGEHPIRAERAGRTASGGQWALEVGGVRVEINGRPAGPEMVAHLTRVAADAIAAVLSGKNGDSTRSTPG